MHEKNPMKLNLFSLFYFFANQYTLKLSFLSISLFFSSLSNLLISRKTTLSFTIQFSS